MCEECGRETDGNFRNQNHLKINTMKKCIVTRLQGVVNDDSLPRIGELLLPFYMDKYLATPISIGAWSNTVDGTGILSGGYFTKSNTDATSTGSVKNIGMNINANTYAVITESGSLRLSKKAYLNRLTTLQNANLHYVMDTSMLRYLPSLTFFESNGDDLSGDISDLSLFPEIKKKVYVASPHSDMLHGSLSSFSRCVKLEDIGFVGCWNVSGEVKEFLDGLRAAGRKDGTLIVRMQNSGVTYNGAKINSNIKVTFTDSGYTVS